MIRYVSTDGSDDANGETLATAWRTIAHAYAQGATVINVEPGTYAESVDVGVSGTSTVPIVLRRRPGAVGEVIVDGTGFEFAIRARSRNYLEFRDLVVTNRGGVSPYTAQYPAARGIILDSNYHVSGSGIGCSYITLERVTFRDVIRTASGFGTPFVAGSYGADGIGAATHHIRLLSCDFHNSPIDYVSAGLGVGALILTGNVHDVEISDCTFTYDSDVADAERWAGIEMPGNYYAPALPNQARRVVVRRCTFDTIGSGDVDTGYAIYLQATDAILVDDCFIRAWARGVGFVTEHGQGTHEGSRLWIRDCVFADVQDQDIVAGAWSSSYDDVHDLYVSNCTSWRAIDGDAEPIFLLAGGSGVGVDGAHVVDCIVSAPGRVLYNDADGVVFDRVVWCSDSAAPFRIGGTPVAWPFDASRGELRAANASAFTGPTTASAGFQLGGLKRVGAGIESVRVPPWYVANVFGAYGGARHVIVSVTISVGG